MSEHITKITLQFPFTNGLGEEVKEINMRRVKVKDIRLMSAKSNDAEKETFLLSQITGLVPEDLDLMDVADYVALQSSLQDMQAGKSAKK